MNQQQYRVAWPPITKPMIGVIVGFFVVWLGSLQGAPLHELCGELDSAPPAEEALCELYYRQPSHVEVPRDDLAASLHVENWKYIWNAPGEESLFDLDADP